MARFPNKSPPFLHTAIVVNTTMHLDAEPTLDSETAAMIRYFPNKSMEYLSRGNKKILIM